MPRGVYDRSKRKTETSTTTTKKTATPETRGRKRMAALPSAGAHDQFDILRQNIVALSSIRTHTNEDDLLEHIDTELVAEIDTLRNLRRQTFGLTADEQGSHENSHASSVPLPPSPPAFTPPPVTA